MPRAYLSEATRLVVITLSLAVLYAALVVTFGTGN